MDGSFSQAPGRGQTPMSPASSSSNSYQVNVNRKKTRKWVEAKVQSYDGDDWGAPDPDDDEDDEPESPPVAAPPPPRPSANHRLPSETRVPGAGRPGHVATPSATSNLSRGSGSQPLSLQTRQQSFGVPGQSARDNIVSPQSAPGQPATRPADIFHRLEEEKQRQGQTAEPDLAPAGTVQADADNSEPKRLSTSPQLPSVTRMSGFGADLFANSTALPSSQLTSGPAGQGDRVSSPGHDEEETVAKPPDPMASGPTLPATTFTPAASADPAGEPEKTAEGELQRPSLPGTYVTENPTITTEQNSSQITPDDAEVSPVSDRDDTTPKGLPGSAPEGDSLKQLHAEEQRRSLPPLRTPSPHEPRTVPPPVSDVAVAQPPSPEKPASGITPTEPLQPKKPEHSPSDYSPLPLERQLTVDTVTSSPRKESDVLSEEIMRTLTPGGIGSPVDNNNNRKSGVTRAGRESSYSLSGYDDYWADSDEKQGDDPTKKSSSTGGLDNVPEQPPMSGPTSTEVKSPELAVVSPQSTTSQPGLRRKFSWEAEEELSSKAIPTVSPPSTVATSPLAQQPQQAPGFGPTSPTIKIVADAEPEPFSHQVSQASSGPAPTVHPLSPEPPSPVSEVTDRDATPLAEPRESQLSGTRENSIAPSAPASVTGTQQGEAGAASVHPASGQKIMTFREIMNIKTPAKRIEKYAETRGIFATQDSGLDNWIAAMRSDYPEHARATALYSGAARTPPPSAKASEGTGQQASAQQPYYQQYLNASTPASNTGSARSRLAGLPHQAQVAAGSAFGHGGNQIGTKGKEFMQSAGKMGKGLFSKGKSKLRGTGDKGDSPSQSQSPPVDGHLEDTTTNSSMKAQKIDRRKSWIPSLGPKSRTGATPQITASSGNTSSNNYSTEGNYSTRTRTSMDASLGASGGPRRVSTMPMPATVIGAQQSYEHAGQHAGQPTGHPHPSGQGQGVFQRVFQRPLSGGGGVGAAVSTSAEGQPAPGSAGWPPGAPATIGAAGNIKAGAVAGPGHRSINSISDDWVVVPRQPAGVVTVAAIAGHPGLPGQPGQPGQPGDQPGAGLPRLQRDLRDLHDTQAAPAHNAQAFPRAAPTTAVHQDSGVAIMASHQSDPSRPDAQRNSSFKGLPPIPRSESFGLSSFDVLTEAEQRVAAQDQASADHATQSFSHDNHHNGSLQPSENATNQSVGGDSNTTLVGQDGTNRTGRSPLSQKEPMRYYQPPTHPPSHQLQYDPSIPSQLQQSDAQSPPGQPATVSPQPPSGWQLEESHLAEPLHVARRRAGTGGSQQPSDYGFDKETGASGPISPVSAGHGSGPAPTASPGPQPPRGRTSDVPPSSAQRYPELFRPAPQPPQQHGYPHPQGQPMPGHRPYQPRMSYESSAPTMVSQRSSFETTSAQIEERGRAKSSGVFRGIGDRFRAASRERRISASDHQQQQNAQSPMQNGSHNPPGDPQGPKKRRPSFIPNLRPRASSDMMASSPRPQSPALSQSQESQAPEESIMSKSEKKRSFLGAAGRFIPSSMSRPSTATANNDAASTSTGANETASMGPPKKRFSGFADRAAGFTSKFRPSHDGQQKPGTSHSRMSSASGLAYDQATSQASMSPPPKTSGRNIGTPDSASSFGMPPPPPPKSEKRPASIGSLDMALPPAPGSEHQERRGRRGSFTGMISNLVGGRSSSKSRQGEEQHPTAPMQSIHGSQLAIAPAAPVPQPPQHREIPDESPTPGGHGRGPSWDATQRVSRHLSGGYMRPSPLAQETSATAGESTPHPDTDRSTYNAAPPGEPQSPASHARGPSDGKVSPMPASQGPNSPQVATFSIKGADSPRSRIASPTPSGGEKTTPPQTTSPPGSTHPSQASPHLTSVPQSSPPGFRAQSPFQPRSQTPQSAAPASPSVHTRAESITSQATQRQFAQSPVGPSREGTPVAQQPQQQATSPGLPYGNQPPPQQRPMAPNSLPNGQYPQQTMGAPGNLPHQMYNQPPGIPPQGRAPNGQLLTQPGVNQQGIPAQGQQPPAGQVRAQDPKRKGWKNRISSQMSQMTAPSVQAPKPAKSDRPSAGDKLRGAFRRVSKANEPTTPAPPPKQGALGQPPQPGQPGQQQWRPSPVQQGRGVPPQQGRGMPPQQVQGMPPQQGRGAPPQLYAGQPPYGQYAYQGQPGAPNMHPAQQYYQQQQQQPQQQQQYQQAQWAAAGRPMMVQQWSQGQQMPGHQGQQQVQRPGELQYASVPIPKGYNAVHGEGITAPTNYYVGRPPGQHLAGQQSYGQQQQQQGFNPQGQAPASQPRHVSSPLATTGPYQQNQQTSPERSGSATPGEQGGFNLPIQGNITPADEGQASQRFWQDAQNVHRKGSILSDAGQSVESGALGANGERAPPPGQVNQGHYPQPRSSTTSMNAKDPSRGSSQVSSNTEVGQTRQTGPPRSASLSPDTALEGRNGSKGKDLTVDVDKSKQDMEENIYDATPRLKQDRTGESKGVSDISKSNSNGSARGKENINNTAAHVELEDTADAHMRTIRLRSQEEKIFYDPEGDVPKMSATSYPGQEWNPYGEPEFADFKDD